MRYRQRLALSAVASLCVNLAVLLVPWQQQAARARVYDTPLVVRIQTEPPRAPEPPPSPPQVVEATVEAHRPVEETNLLSDRDAVAADAVQHDGTEPGPRLDEQADLVSLPAVPAPPREAPPTAGIEEHRDTPRPKDAQKTRRAADAEIEGLLDAPAPERPDADADDAGRAEERRVLAQVPPPLADAPQRGRGRVDGRVLERGFTSFEALRDDVAAYYLHHIKPLIRRSWITIMLTRYSGSTRAVAEVELAIAPDGRIVSAVVVGEPTSRIYAALCRESILRAGSFKPFPFRVPPEYRDENLVIHCTFQWQ
ncbi:MAG TPA: hypothetical protein PKI11_14235 [Candidatus Hydrogenedentes bacterium]|nr:hypothetical protein [Candidatus Hydrogenedentota bacterium]